MSSLSETSFYTAALALSPLLAEFGILLKLLMPVNRLRSHVWLQLVLTEHGFLVSSVRTSGSTQPVCCVNRVSSVSSSAGRRGRGGGLASARSCGGCKVITVCIGEARLIGGRAETSLLRNTPPNRTSRFCEPYPLSAGEGQPPTRLPTR